MTGKQLKAIRERLGLSQADFAERLKLSRVSVTRMEYGSQVIKPSMAYFVELVAKELGVDAASHTRAGRRAAAPQKAGGASTGHPARKGRREKDSVS